MDKFERILTRMAVVALSVGTFAVCGIAGMNLPSDSVGAYLCSVGLWVCLVAFAWSGAILIAKGGDK